MPRCSGTSTFRRVQLLVFKVAGKSGGWSLTVHKNEWSGLVESLMWPTKRVTRLRATNNNCLYPFSSLVVLFSLTRPSSFLFADTTCLFVFVVFPSSRSLSASFIRRSNSNSCRKKLGNLPRPNAFAFGVVGSGSQIRRSLSAITDLYFHPHSILGDYLILIITIIIYIPQLSKIICL